MVFFGGNCSEIRQHNIPLYGHRPPLAALGGAWVGMVIAILTIKGRAERISVILKLLVGHYCANRLINKIYYEK